MGCLDNALRLMLARNGVVGNPPAVPFTPAPVCSRRVVERPPHPPADRQPRSLYCRRPRRCSEGYIYAMHHSALHAQAEHGRITRLPGWLPARHTPLTRGPSPCTPSEADPRRTPPSSSPRSSPSFSTSVRCAPRASERPRFCVSAAASVVTGKSSWATPSTAIPISKKTVKPLIRCGVLTCDNISVEGLACHARGSHPWVRLNNGTTGEFK